MSQDDVMKITVDKSAVGVVGLKQIMEDMKEDFTERPDEEVQNELLKRLSKKNYIPDRVKESYKKAFLREFKKFMGRSYEENVSQGLEIKVLGPGCAQCDRLEQDLMVVMSELNLAGDIEHIREIKEITTYRVLGTPALIINGKVKSVGRVPTRSQLTAWLKEAKG